jgi:hypothetical protein
MPMWGGYWGSPWGAFGWIFPLIGLLFMVVMVVVCFRMMGGTSGFGCMSSYGAQAAEETKELRREVLELKEEIRKLRGRS